MKLNRILLALPELKEGGVERHVFDLASALVSRGYLVAVMANNGIQTEKFIQSGAQIINLQINSKNPVVFLNTLTKVRQEIFKFKPDVIHVHSRVPAWHLWLSKGRIPFVTTCHGKYSKNLLSRIMYKGQPTIGVSNYCLKDFPNGYRTDNNPNVIYNGIELHLQNTISKKSARDKLSTMFHLTDEYIIGTVARFTKLKRLDKLIEAIAQLTDIPLKLVLIGSGSEEDNLRRLVAQYKIESKTIFIGVRLDLAQILPGLDAFVNPCPVEGGTSYSVLEAMDMLVPCIGANSGGVSELIKHKFNGLLFEADNSLDLSSQIRHLYENPKEALSFALNARKILADEFSIDHMIDKILTVYNQALLWR